MNKIIPIVFNINELEARAKNSDGLSCYILGRSYDSGENGVKQNFEKALYWYNKGKLLGDPRCIYGVGACYYFGDGIEQDKDQAYQLFVKEYQPLLESIEQEKDTPNKQAFSIFCLGAYYYFNKQNYEYIGLDFSKKMKDCAYNLHGEFPYIVDDMVNVKKYFSNNSLDAVFAIYSLFHLPKNDFNNLFSDVYDILKVNGLFLFTYQIGQGEDMADEPYLNEKGKNSLYMCYHTNEEINDLLHSFSYTELFKKQKIKYLLQLLTVIVLQLSLYWLKRLNDFIGIEGPIVEFVWEYKFSVG